MWEGYIEPVKRPDCGSIMDVTSHKRSHLVLGLLVWAIYLPSNTNLELRLGVSCVLSIYIYFISMKNNYILYNFTENLEWVSKDALVNA